MHKILLFLLLALSAAVPSLAGRTYSVGSMSYHAQARGTVQSIAIAVNRIVIDGRTFAFAPQMKVYKYVPATDGSASGLKQLAAISEIRVGDVVDFGQEGTMITEIYLKRW